MSKKPKTIRQLIKIADRLFSQYTRLMYATGVGYCTCVTCGKPYHWNACVEHCHGVPTDFKYIDKKIHKQKGIEL